MERKHLSVGFSRRNIDPPLGIAMRGYFKPRYASGILDSLQLNAVAFSMDAGVCPAARWNPDTGEYEKAGAGGSCAGVVLLVSVDNCGLSTGQCRDFRGLIAERTGIPAGNILIHSIHTHTGPYTEDLDDSHYTKGNRNLISDYFTFLRQRILDAAEDAVADLKPARMGFIVGRAPERVAYIRRYRMKDGSTWTCPPINDPNIDHPIGTLDQRVNVLRFDREGGETIVLMNYGLHADCLNLDLISPDWPGWTARTFEAAVPDARLVFFNGCEGDVGSTHVFPEGGDMNDTRISFDNEMKSPGMARFVGRALAGTVLQVYDKAEYVPVDGIAALERTIPVAANVPSPEQLPLAHRYMELHNAGRDAEIPYTAMELTTAVAEAGRICRLENGPDHFDLTLIGVRLGPVALLGIPGEPFTEIGRQIKAAEGWRCILPVCLSNGSEGYFPMREAFDEGGYEARSSRFRGGVAEAVIAGAKELLRELQ